MGAGSGLPRIILRLQMTIIDKIRDHDRWIEFLNYKLGRANMKKRDSERLRKFVENREYVKIVDMLAAGREMPLPRLVEVNKNGSDKKRLVFSFGTEENLVMKMMAYLLKDYDFLFCDNLYSFRNDTGVKKAVNRILSRIDFRTAYSYKVDIHDYFNSINTKRILELLECKMPEEKWFLGFLRKLLENPYAIKDGEQIKIKKGVMAGIPVSGFLANLYLGGMDKYFYDRNIVYARYSDDIIVFSNTQEQIKEYESVIGRMLGENELEINPKKEIRTFPGEKVEFLGFEFFSNETNISGMAEKKIKAKIKRKARALYRWKIRKNAGDERTARAFIRFLNNKFYDNPVRNEITWCRWYFPLITTDARLKAIDDYAVSNIRYLYTGKYGKQNYNLRYAEIKSMGFRSLVNNFWKYKEGKYEIEQAVSTSIDN